MYSIYSFFPHSIRTMYRNCKKKRRKNRNIKFLALRGIKCYFTFFLFGVLLLWGLSTCERNRHIIGLLKTYWTSALRSVSNTSQKCTRRTVKKQSVARMFHTYVKTNWYKRVELLTKYFPTNILFFLTAGQVGQMQMYKWSRMVIN